MGVMVVEKPWPDCQDKAALIIALVLYGLLALTVLTAFGGASLTIPLVNEVQSGAGTAIGFAIILALAKVALFVAVPIIMLCKCCFVKDRQSFYVTMIVYGSLIT